MTLAMPMGPGTRSRALEGLFAPFLLHHDPRQLSEGLSHCIVLYSTFK